MEFTLMTKINPNVGPAENGGRPYISDVLFHEGFFKMSKLRLLNFARSYQVIYVDHVHNKHYIYKNISIRTLIKNVLLSIICKY